MRTVSRFVCMSMVVLFCGAMAFLLILSSGAHALFESRDAKIKLVRTVGIVSAMGDQFTLVRAGLTGPDHSSRSLPIASWGLDDLIVQQVTDALSTQFQVQPVTYPRATFAAIEESAITAFNLVRGDPFKELVQSEVSPQGLDAYIIITKASAHFNGGNQKAKGAGLITYSTVLESFGLLHALYEIRVIDGKTFDIIERLSAGPQDDASGVRLPGPSLLIDTSFDKGEENLRRATVDLIQRSLPITLIDMHLLKPGK